MLERLQWQCLSGRKGSNVFQIVVRNEATDNATFLDVSSRFQRPVKYTIPDFVKKTADAKVTRRLREG